MFFFRFKKKKDKCILSLRKGTKATNSVFVPRSFFLYIYPLLSASVTNLYVPSFTSLSPPYPLVVMWNFYLVAIIIGANEDVWVRLSKRLCALFFVKKKTHFTVSFFKGRLKSRNAGFFKSHDHLNFRIWIPNNILNDPVLF